MTTAHLNMNPTTIHNLPPEIRQQIWSQLPLLSLLNLRFLSKDLFCDVETLFCSRNFANDLLERLHTRVTLLHKETLEKYLKSANVGASDEHIHTMFVLIHLMKSIGHMKLSFDGHQPSHHGYDHMQDHAHVAESRRDSAVYRRHALDSRALVRELLKRCGSATRQCNQGRGALWSDDLRKMLYPKVEYCLLDT